MCAACVFSFYRLTTSCSAPHEFALMQINNAVDRLTDVNDALCALGLGASCSTKLAIGLADLPV
jgi:hypothetical protein